MSTEPVTTWDELLAAVDHRADLAAHTLAEATRGASLCSVSRSGERIEGVKYPEGRWAAMRELRRRWTRLEHTPGEPVRRHPLVMAVLAELSVVWRADLDSRRSDGNSNWMAYRTGGVDALEEMQDLLAAAGPPAS